MIAEGGGSMGNRTLAAAQCDITSAMLRRGILHRGNPARLAAAMRKAERGGTLTLAAIGGSITQGCAAETAEARYVNRFAAWWREAFPHADIRLVNAGIGATDSYLAVHRVQTDVLDAMPDVVLVEFSVNDADKAFHLQTYDSLVRRLLLAPSAPAVLLLCMTREDGVSLEKVHQRIGLAYDLSVFSYGNVVLPEITAGHFAWRDISPDNIHPNSTGHGIVAAMLAQDLDAVRTARDACTGNTAFAMPPCTMDRYAAGRLLDHTTLTPSVLTGFAAGTSFPPFLHGWTARGAGAVFSASVFCRQLGVLYLRTTDGRSGRYSVFVDGSPAAMLDGDFSDGWGDYAAAAEVCAAAVSVAHTITIRQTEGGEPTGFSVLGLLVS